MSGPVLEARNLSRWYGDVLGILEISFRTDRGVTALLGPNGAGKTTLLRILTGRIRPSRGEIRLFGRDPWKDRKVLARVGYSPEMAPLYPRISARAFLEDLLRIHGYPRREARRRAGEALELTGLGEAADRNAGGFSKGMRQRLRLAQALAHEPELLLLDEPLTGLDPMARGFVMEKIREWGRNGRTVLVSSHVLHEVEEMTDNVLILHHGRLLAAGSIYEIRELLEGRSLRVQIRCSEPRRLFARLAGREDVTRLELAEDGESLTVETRGPDAFHQRLLEEVRAAEVELHGIASPDERLEAIFETLVQGGMG